jgi:IS5 family transposase
MRPGLPRAGIEPINGHLKSDHRMGRNFYKGIFGDMLNAKLAAAAFNFKRAMRHFFVLLEWLYSFCFLWNGMDKKCERRYIAFAK